MSSYIADVCTIRDNFINGLVLARPYYFANGKEYTIIRAEFLHAFEFQDVHDTDTALLIGNVFYSKISATERT